MRHHIIASVICSVIIGLPVASGAGEPETVAGATCVPFDTTIADAKYQVNYGGVEFKTGQTGLLGFTCPVASLANGTYEIYNWFSNDDDGSSLNDYYVETVVRRRNKSTGTNATLCDFYSDSTGHGNNSCSGVGIDTDTYLYYVYVYVWRDTTQTTSIRFNAISWIPSV